MESNIPEVGCSEQPTKVNKIVSDAQAAWDRLNRFQDFDDWVLVASALAMGRDVVMHLAQTNKASGLKYKREINRWLRENKLDTVDKTTRSRSIEFFAHLDDIKKWRATLTDTERRLLNHPTTILRHWKRKTSVSKPPDVKKVSPTAKLKASIAELEEQNFRMKREIERGGGDLWTPQDTAKNIAIAIFPRLTCSKADDLGRELRNMAREARKPAPPKAVVKIEQRRSTHN